MQIPRSFPARCGRSTGTPIWRCAVAHSWKLVAAAQGVVKHVCRHCATVRTRTNRHNEFPLVRYVTPDGAVLTGKGPICGEVHATA